MLPNPIKSHRPRKSNAMVNALQMWRDGEKAADAADFP
jgi:hypothetical protein